MRRSIRILLYVLSALVVLALGTAGYYVHRYGLRNVTGLLRYDQRHEGTLAVGDPAPDVSVESIDGTPARTIRSYLSGRPLVLIFGSFT